MPLKQLLPARLRVALRAVRNDVRGVRRAAREERFKGARPPSSNPFYESIAVRSDVVMPAPPSPSVAPSVGGVVEFADSGVTVELEAGETILEAGLRHGVDLLFSCTLGGCGACMLQVTQGEVEYDDPDGICLSDEEIREGSCLACVGRPRGHVVLEA